MSRKMSKHTRDYLNSSKAFGEAFRAEMSKGNDTDGRVASMNLIELRVFDKEMHAACLLGLGYNIQNPWADEIDGRVAAFYDGSRLANIDRYIVHREWTRPLRDDEVEKAVQEYAEVTQ